MEVNRYLGEYISCVKKDGVLWFRVYDDCDELYVDTKLYTKYKTIERPLLMWNAELTIIHSSDDKISNHIILKGHNIFYYNNPQIKKLKKAEDLDYLLDSIEYEKNSEIFSIFNIYSVYLREGLVMKFQDADNDVSIDFTNRKYVLLNRR